MALTSERAAYVAGAIDGEGSLSLIPQGRNRGSTTGFQFRLSITNTSKSWLETLQGWIGGRYYEVGHKSSRNKRPCYQLRLTGAEARSLLIDIGPYLLIKKRHGQLLIEFLDLVAKRKALNGTARTTPEISTRIVEIYGDLKQANLRGAVPVVHAGPAKSDRQCSVDGCGGKHYGKGYCLSHYRRYIEHGGFKIYERECMVCKAPFVARRSDTECCSKPCGDRQQYLKNQDHRNAYKREWRARKSAESA